MRPVMHDAVRADRRALLSIVAVIALGVAVRVVSLRATVSALGAGGA
jgi:hypothetical protein